MVFLVLVVVGVFLFLFSSLLSALRRIFCTYCDGMPIWCCTQFHVWIGLCSLSIERPWIEIIMGFLSISVDYYSYMLFELKLFLFRAPVHLAKSSCAVAVLLMLILINAIMDCVCVCIWCVFLNFVSLLLFFSAIRFYLIVILTHVLYAHNTVPTFIFKNSAHCWMHKFKLVVCLTYNSFSCTVFGFVFCRFFYFFFIFRFFLPLPSW